MLTREAILKVARAVLIEEGHEALSLRCVARKLEVTAAALYAHFENKFDLMRNLASDEYLRGAARYEAIKTKDPIERLREISHVYVDQSRNEPNIFRFLLMFPPIGAWNAPEENLAGGAKVFQIAADPVEDGIAQGLFKDEDAFMMSIAIWTSVHGVASFIIQDAEFISVIADELVDNVVGAMLSGLAANEKARADIEKVFSVSKPKLKKTRRK